MMIIRRSWLSSVILFVLATGTIQLSASPAQDVKTLQKRFAGQIPPEIVSQKEHWLSKSAPVTLAELKGKVIWLQFNF